MRLQWHEVGKRCWVNCFFDFKKFLERDFVTLSIVAFYFQKTFGESFYYRLFIIYYLLFIIYYFLFFTVFLISKNFWREFLKSKIDVFLKSKKLLERAFEIKN